jgi:hypothetical protein
MNRHSLTRELRSRRYLTSVKSPWGEDIRDEQSMNISEVILLYLSDR